MGRRKPRAVSAEWFRHHVLPAFDDSWDDAEGRMLADPFERRRIAELKEELVGGFERPIVIRRDHWFSRFRVADGMHRALAGMLLDTDLLIRHGYPPPDLGDATDLYTVTPTAQVCSDEFLDAVLALSSFRCAAGLWVQCDIASGERDGPVRLHLTHHAGLESQIAGDLTERLRESGLLADVAYIGPSED